MDGPHPESFGRIDGRSKLGHQSGRVRVLQSSGSASGPRRYSCQWCAIGALLASSAACAPGTAAPPRTEAQQQVAGGLPGAVVDLSPVVWKPGLAPLAAPALGSLDPILIAPSSIAGTKDEQFDFHRVRDAVQLLRDQGEDVTLDQKYRGSHFAMCSYVPELTRAGRWPEQHVFSTGLPPAAGGPGP